MEVLEVQTQDATNEKILLTIKDIQEVFQCGKKIGTVKISTVPIILFELINDFSTYLIIRWRIWFITKQFPVYIIQNWNDNCNDNIPKEKEY